MATLASSSAVPSNDPPAAPPRLSTSTVPTDLFTPSKLSSWVWQHFRLSRSDPDHAWCSVSDCPPSRQRVARKRGNTSGAIEHLRKRHNIREPSASTSASAVSVRDQLVAQSKHVTPCSASFKTTVDAHTVQFFISNCLPFNVADSPSFVKLLHAATGGSYMPLARSSLTASVDTLYQSMLGVLMADVKDNTLSITSDAATLDNGQSYITITGHYITPAMRMRDVALFVARMTGSHTGEYVSDLLDMTISAWKADDRCFALVTDNGANFVNAARLADKVQDELRCACHTLQLALKDGVAGQPILKQLCVDAQHVVVVIRRSALLTETLHKIQELEAAASSVNAPDEGGNERDPTRPLKLAMNVPTRFNSMHILFDRLLDLQDAVQQVCRARPADFEKVLSDDQWEQISELVSVLAPVKSLCDVLERSSTPSLSLLIPLTCRVIDDLGKLYGSLKIPSCRTVCEKVRLSVHTRMASAMSDPTCMISMMLDPRVRTKVVVNYNKDVALQALRDAFINFPATLAKYRGAQSVAIRHGENRAEEVKEEPAPKRVKYVLELDEESAPAPDAVSELDLYLREDSIGKRECPLQWWLERKLRYPVLFEMARVYLAIPASSAPSERVFSVGGLVLSDRRRQLLESRVATLMFMKRNMELYNALVGNNTKKPN